MADAIREVLQDSTYDPMTAVKMKRNPDTRWSERVKTTYFFV